MAKGKNKGRSKQQAGSLAKAPAKALAKPLNPGDIITRTPVGRRSALGLIGGVVGGSVAGSVTPRMARAQTGDIVDVTRNGDPIADADTGAGADRTADTDISVLADRPEGFDDDITTVGDLADEDVGPFADTGDSDRPVIADRKTTGASDSADIDISQRGDPVPRVDIDPTDTGGDADLSTRADTADQD